MFTVKFETDFSYYDIPNEPRLSTQSCHRAGAASPSGDMEQLNKIRVAAENSIRERARKQAEARVAELERGGRLDELTPAKTRSPKGASTNGASSTSIPAPRTPATAPASASKTPRGSGGGSGTPPYATPAPDFASSTAMEDIAVSIASLQSELEAMRRRQALVEDGLLDAREDSTDNTAAIDEAVTRRIQESVASIIAPYVEATIGRVREEMRAQILAETEAKIDASNDAAEATVMRIGGLLGAAEAAARGAKEAAAAAEEASVSAEQRTARAEAHAKDAKDATADALARAIAAEASSARDTAVRENGDDADETTRVHMDARFAALEASVADAIARADAAEKRTKAAEDTAKAAVAAAEQTARDVESKAKSAESKAEKAHKTVKEIEKKAKAAEAKAAAAEAKANEAEAKAAAAEAKANEVHARPPPPPTPPAPPPPPAPAAGLDPTAVADAVRLELAADIESLKRAANEAVDVARQARGAQSELRDVCMDEVRSIRAAVKSLAPVVGAPAPPSPIKPTGSHETEEAKEAIDAKLRTELDHLKRRVENLVGIASTAKSAEDAANEANRIAKQSLKTIGGIEGEVKVIAVKADDAIASAASALAAANAAAEEAAAAAESVHNENAEGPEGPPEGSMSSVSSAIDDVNARVDALHKELKETSVIVQTNAEGIAFLGQQAMLTAKKNDLDELRTSVDKTAERTRKETDALKAATQASFEELEGRTKKLERGARKQSESPKPSPAPADGTAVTPQAVSALESRMAKLEAATPTHPNPPPMDAADVSAAAEKYESTARELTARVERLQEAVGVEMLAQMKRMDAKLKTVEISLGEVKQQGIATRESKQTSNSTDKPGKLDKANAQRLASAEKAAAESRSTAEDAAEKAKLASEKAKAALAAVAEHAATAERVKEAEARMKDLATEIEKFRADVAEMEVSSATNTADVVAIEGEWASARRHLKDLEQSVWKSMVMIREETGVGTPSSDAGAGTPATPATGHGDDATAATPAQREAGRTPETPMSGFRALFSRGRRTNSAPRSAGDSESARRLRARQTASPERSNTSRSEALIEALDMGSPTRPARRSANRGR